MGNAIRSALRPLLGSFSAWLLLAPAAHAGVPAAPPTCPEGATPVAFVRLAAFGLPDEIPTGASVDVARLTLAPGEELQPETTGYTAFYVASGTLRFRMPLRGGFHLEHPAHCTPVGGAFSGGGVEAVDDEGWMRVESGSTLVSEEVPIERIGNAGGDPLELIQVTLRFPEIDPETGQPIGDELVTDRGNRERKNERRERRDATPTP
jgi:hypothetical protein